MTDPAAIRDADQGRLTYTDCTAVADPTAAGRASAAAPQALRRRLPAGAARAKECQVNTFKEFPPRQKAGSFGIDNVLESLQSGVAA